MKPRRRFHPRILASIIARQDGKCACCGEHLGADPRQIEFDHVVELWNGGEDSPDNLCAMIKSCHRVKTRREAAARAKVKRLGRGPRMSQQDRMLARILEQEGDHDG